MAEIKYFVRIRPYNPKQLAITRRCTYAGKRFEHERGWYGPIDETRAEAMSAVLDHKGNPIFDVKAEAQAARETTPDTIKDAEPAVFRPTAAERAVQEAQEEAERIKEERQDAKAKAKGRKAPLLSPGETILPAAAPMYEDAPEPEAPASKKATPPTKRTRRSAQA